MRLERILHLISIYVLLTGSARYQSQNQKPFIVNILTVKLMKAEDKTVTGKGN